MPADRAQVLVDMEEIDINEEQLAFYFELGLAITQFKHLSDHLFYVLELTINFTAPEKSDAIAEYVNAQTFGHQLRIARKFFPANLPNEFQAEWAVLDRELTDAKEKRNTLAHSWIMVDAHRSPGERVMLLPSSGSRWIGGKSIPDHAVFLLDIVDYRYKFFAVGNRLQNLDWRLRGKPNGYSDGKFDTPTRPILMQVIKQPYHYLRKNRF